MPHSIEAALPQLHVRRIAFPRQYRQSVMTELVANLHLSDHSAGCPTSPAEPLWLPDHPGLCLLAHGAQSACAVVQIAQVQNSLDA